MQTIGGTQTDQALGITFSNGTAWINVVGFFMNTATITGANGSTTTLTSAGSEDAFLLTYAHDAFLVSSYRYGGSATDEATAVAVTANGGQLFVSGYFYGQSVIGGQMLTASGADSFLVKTDSSFFPIWVRQLGGSGDQFGFAVADDGDGNVYLAGRVTGMTDFGGTVYQSVGGSNDAFACKYSGGGQLIWSAPFGGSGDDTAWAVGVDAIGRAYPVGTFRGTADLDPTSGQSLHTSANTDTFITCLALAAPRISTTQVNDGSAQRSRVTSLTVTFNYVVSFAGPVGNAFTLTRTGGGSVSFTAQRQRHQRRHRRHALQLHRSAKLSLVRSRMAATR